jgi:S-adenosylmethionine:tRNA ribosyltransferase-isomerase
VARIEATLLEPLADGRVARAPQALRKVRDGEEHRFSDRLTAVVAGREEGAARLVFNLKGEDFDAALAEAGEMPLPPYIAQRRPADAQDREDYQTVWARRDGAVAAPTASLHFDEPLARGAGRARGRLHPRHAACGRGHLPAGEGRRCDATHRMHAEWGEITPEAAAEIDADARRGRADHPGRHHGAAASRKRRARGRHGAALAGGDRHLHHAGLRVPRLRRADDELPPAEVDADDAGLGAHGGRARSAAIYAHAVAEGYRFFSYGDASLLVPERRMRR